MRRRQRGPAKGVMNTVGKKMSLASSDPRQAFGPKAGFGAGGEDGFPQEMAGGRHAASAAFGFP